MAQGKTLTLPNGGELGMGEDMSIGFLLHHRDGSVTIGGLSTMDLALLDQLLTEQGIGLPILGKD
jgi:hypothetical protein